MILYTKNNGILLNFVKSIIYNYDLVYAAIEIIPFRVLFK